MRSTFCMILALLILVQPSPATALCSGASVTQEYREADVVVRARVVAETMVWDDEPSAEFRARWGESGYVQLYRFRVSHVFKGRPGPTINLFQEVNSGRFPVDIDEDYLLFLSYIRPHASRPSAARGAMTVRYACGQSKRWSEVRPQDLARVQALARGR